MAEDQKNNTPVIRISMQFSINEKRGLSFETYVGADQKVEFINAMLDKLCFAADRKIATYELVGMEAQYETESANLKALEENYALLQAEQGKRYANSGKSLPIKLSPVEAKNKQEVELNIKNRIEYLKRLRVDIEKRKAISEGGNLGNSNSPANS